MPPAPLGDGAGPRPEGLPKEGGAGGRAIGRSDAAGSVDDPAPLGLPPDGAPNGREPAAGDPAHGHEARAAVDPAASDPVSGSGAWAGGEAVPGPSAEGGPSPMVPGPPAGQPGSPVGVPGTVATADLSPRRLHPAWIVLSLVRSVRGFLIPLVVILFTGRLSEAPFLAVGGTLAALSLAAQTVTWSVFRYEVTGGELRVRSGLLNRRDRSVPLERIQTVDVAETPLQRALGVVQIKVETAAGGSAGSDVTLEALARGDAAVLRDRLEAARSLRRGRLAAAGSEALSAPQEGQAPAGSARPASLAFGESGELIRAITPRELLVAGATSGRIGPALAIFGAGFQLVDDVLPDRIWERLAMSAPGVGFRGFLVAAVLIGVGAWLLAVVTTVLTFGGFALRRDGDQLQISSGLLDRRRTTVPLARIQAVTMTEGLLRQPFGLAALRIESAGYGSDSATSGVLFPLLRRAEVTDLLERACPAVAVPLAGADALPLDRLPPRARPRYLLAGIRPPIVLTVVATVVAWRVDAAPWWWGLAPLLVVPPAALLALLAYRDAGWAVDARDRLVVRNRAVARTTVVMPVRRIQRRTIARDLFQRRAGLGTFRAAVASGGGGGRVEIVHLDDAQADALLTRLAPPRQVARRHARRATPIPSP
ncbi:MAG: hypothetical protein AVDCRST_MAG49-42 [uncultured Thermomicrobiales bacterium]|uniref:YdbS-like PH domain-containing protein n=1 Tax=uncultured Thermomicrobiales bacterium TaxID=1645740 RepID=A0A6J4TX73_9BACT|nr:MAG: hypothetical protein AVDCRST_MAG49-42 [uncultured Thermomicrobiales bacterium]